MKKRVVEYSLSCIIGVLAYFFWALPFRSVLNYHEEFQLFLLDSDYFLSHLKQMGGFSVYISEFFVQFYNNYWIGSIVIAIEFFFIHQLTLTILKSFNVFGVNNYRILIYCLSLVPTLVLWLVLGDVNIMHSLIIAVIIALLLLYVLVITIHSATYRFIGLFLAPIAYVWLAGTSHYRIPNSTFSFEHVYNHKTLQILDYDFLVRTNRWQQIIESSEQKQPDLPLTVCATNLALGMTNQIGRRAKEFYQNGTEGLFPPFTKESFSTLTTAEVYFHLGLMNTAQRYYFEAMEASPNYSKSCRCIRRLAETNMINGQYEVARKYLHILSKTLFYKKWACRTLQLINAGDWAILQHPLYGRLRRMRLNEDFLFSDREIDKICGRLLMHNNENVLAMQYMLFYTLLENDYNKFIQYMHLVKNEMSYCQELASFEKYVQKH
ncbi:MAG: DUF6057 family protein [Bacteroidales bacterium]|nr:DUF6057 family protein [Bacteroidales bacterium]